MSEFQNSPQLHSEENKHLPRASVQHRLGGYALDGALFLASFFTLFLGWIIWSLVLWGQGQTPAKQILKMRVYSIDTARPASWGHMALRQFLIPTAFSCIYIPFFIAAMAVSVDSSVIATGGVTIIGSLVVCAVQLADALWIFKADERQRITDRWARTYVVNEA